MTTQTEIKLRKMIREELSKKKQFERLTEENGKIRRKITGNNVFLKELGSNSYVILLNDDPICFFNFDGKKNIEFRPPTRNQTQLLITSILDNMGIGNRDFQNWSS